MRDLQLRWLPINLAASAVIVAVGLPTWFVALVAIEIAVLALDMAQLSYRLRTGR